MPFPPITTVDQLQYNLNLGSGYDGYSELIKAIDLNQDELDRVCCWSDNHHTRVCLYDTPGMEALITCWQAGQASAIHNYDFNHGWVKILRGEMWLEFYRVKNDEPILDTELLLHKDSSFYLNDSLGYHRFSNRTDRPAIALLLYADKVTQWQAYNENKGRFEVINTQYDLNLDSAS